MRKVILDTNFLLLPFQLKIDIFSEIEKLVGRFEPIVLSITLDELKKISESGSSKMSRLASLAIDLSKKCKILETHVMPGESHDDALLRVAKENNCIVATNDRILRKKLRKAGITTIFLRQRAYLELEGYI